MTPLREREGLPNKIRSKCRSGSVYAFRAQKTKGQPWRDLIQIRKDLSPASSGGSVDHFEI